MESYSKLFEGLQEPAQSGSSRSTSETSATVLAEIRKINHTLQKQITKVDNIEHHIKEIEKTQKQIFVKYLCSTLPGHSTVVVKGRPGSPGYPFRRGAIM